MRIPGRTMTTGRVSRLPSAVSTVMDSAGLAAGLREQIVPAAGEACTLADSAVFTVASTVSVASTEEDSMGGAKATTNTPGLGEKRMSNLLRDHNIHIVRIALSLTFLA